MGLCIGDELVLDDRKLCQRRQGLELGWVVALYGGSDMCMLLQKLLTQRDDHLRRLERGCCPASQPRR